MLQGVPSLMAARGITSSNNVALVGTQFGGNRSGGGNAELSFAMPGNVTSGNNVLMGVNYFQLGFTYNFAAGDVTQSAGTATIGTVALDGSFSATSGNSGSAVFRIPITGTGSLTLLWTRNGTSTGFIQVGCAEFSGLNASPLDAGGSNSGTGTSHTTGSLTTSVPGMIFYSASEEASSDFTRTVSDTVVRNDQTGSSQYTGIVQFKIISSSPNTLTDNTGADSSNWCVAYGKYKTS